MAATKQQKLDSLATRATAGEFHVEPLPKLAEMIQNYGLKRGAEVYDEAAERWRVTLEQSVNQALRAADVSPGDSA